MATLVMDQKGGLMAPIAARALGLVHSDQEAAVIQAIVERMDEALNALGPNSRRDDDAVEDAVAHAIRRYCWRSLSQRPVVQVMIARL